MDITLVCIIILTAIFSLVGIYLIRVLRLLQQTLSNMEETLKNVQETAEKAHQVAEQAESTFNLLNDRLPIILENVEQTTANTRAITENAEIQLRQDSVIPADQNSTLTTAASLGNYVLKGYSVWKRIKNKRFRV